MSDFPRASAAHRKDLPTREQYRKRLKTRVFQEGSLVVVGGVVVVVVTEKQEQSRVEESERE